MSLIHASVHNRWKVPHGKCCISPQKPAVSLIHASVHNRWKVPHGKCCISPQGPAVSLIRASCITYTCQCTQQVESFSWEMMSYFTTKASCVTYRSQCTQQVESLHCSVVLPVYGMFTSSRGSDYTTAAISISINIYLYCRVSSKICMHIE